MVEILRTRILVGRSVGRPFLATGFEGPSDLESTPLGRGDPTNSTPEPLRRDYSLLTVQPTGRLSRGNRSLVSAPEPRSALALLRGEGM